MSLSEEMRGYLDVIDASGKSHSDESKPQRIDEERIDEVLPALIPAALFLGRAAISLAPRLFPALARGAASTAGRSTLSALAGGGLKWGGRLLTSAASGVIGLATGLIGSMAGSAFSAIMTGAAMVVPKMLDMFDDDEREQVAAMDQDDAKKAIVAMFVKAGAEDDIAEQSAERIVDDAWRRNSESPAAHAMAAAKLLLDQIHQTEQEAKNLPQVPQAA